MDNSNSLPVTPTGAQGASPSNPTASSPSNVALNSPNSFSATPNTANPSGAAASSAGSLGSSGIPAGGIGSASLGLNGNDEPIQTRMADQQAATEFQQAHPNRTTSSAGRGAIKLTNDNPKSNKKWLFIALGAVGALVVIGVVIWMIIASTMKNATPRSSAEQVFAEYERLLIYGSENQEATNEATANYGLGEDDEWYFFNLNEIDIEENDKDNYLAKVQSKYNEYTSMNPVNGISNVEKSNILESTLDRYPDMLTLIIGYYRLSDYEDEIAVSSLDNSKNIDDIINEKIPSIPDSSAIHELENEMKESLRLNVDIAKLYRQYGCIDEKTGVDDACASNIGWDNTMTDFKGDSRLEDIRQKRTQLQIEMDNNFVISCSIFRGLTEEIANLMETVK